MDKKLAPLSYFKEELGKNSNGDINQCYQSYDQDGCLQSRHGMVELLTTMRYIEKYLTPGARILEIGAGTGRYNYALADMGYCVDGDRRKICVKVNEGLLFRQELG